MPTANSTASACTNGGFPAYAVNVTNVAQVQLAVNFARSNNIRLVVKNTGHDFSGKSGGAGALSVWTHYLNNIAYQAKYVDKVLGYSGPAFKFGSGVIAKDAYAAAQAKGLMVIGGEGKVWFQKRFQ
jgi:FAD/FMN-containing dehydrogenase